MKIDADAFPLYWPLDWPRTAAHKLNRAREEALREVQETTR